MFKKIGWLYLEYYIYVKKKQNIDWEIPAEYSEEEYVADVTGALLMLLAHLGTDDKKDDAIVDDSITEEPAVEIEKVRSEGMPDVNV